MQRRMIGECPGHRRARGAGPMLLWRGVQLRLSAESLVVMSGFDLVQRPDAMQDGCPWRENDARHGGWPERPGVDHVGSW
jgi:hypothetical protein